MLSHHRTNGLWDFYSPPKSGNGKKRCQLACDLSLLFCAFFNKCRPPRFTPSKAAGKQLVSERQNANMTKSKRAWDQDKVPHVLGWGPKPRFGVWSESKKGRASCLIPPFTPPPSLLFFYFFKVGLPYLRLWRSLSMWRPRDKAASFVAKRARQSFEWRCTQPPIPPQRNSSLCTGFGLGCERRQQRL